MMTSKVLLCFFSKILNRFALAMHTCVLYFSQFSPRSERSGSVFSLSFLE